MIREFVGVRRKYRLRDRLVLIFPFVLLLMLAATIGLCTEKVASPAPPSSDDKECSCEDCGPKQSSPVAHQPLALARYRILKQIEHRYGEFPLPGNTLFTCVDFLFPLGKSNKVYILHQGDEFTKDGYPVVKLVCYVSKGKGVKLSYSVKLKIVHRPPKDKARVENMLDYLSLLGDNASDPQWKPYSYVVPQSISKYAKRDLSLSQGLVDYSCQTVIQVLFVQCFTSKVAASIRESEYMQAFDMPGDTSCPERLQWYKTYGFPVAECELTANDRKGK